MQRAHRVYIFLDYGASNTEKRQMNKIQSYLEEVGKEMRKVSWPSRSELISNTVITILATIVISLFIFVTDRVISTVLEVIYG